jgi:hypothetical protein
MMIEARETLHVREGFWKSITSKSLADVFAPEEPLRKAEVDLLLDFDRFAGETYGHTSQASRGDLISQWRMHLQMSSVPTTMFPTAMERPPPSLPSLVDNLQS